MKMTLKELRSYIRNALSPATVDREQLGTLGKRDALGIDDEFPDDEIVGSKREIPAVINDPYVTQEKPAPSTGRRKLGIT